MFPAAAVRRDESSLFRVIQLFKRATRRIQQTLDPGAPVRTAYNGPGRLGGVGHRPETSL
jgi:hypothetical protein